MRRSILIPLLLVVGMGGCVVHDPPYATGGYVAYGGTYDYPLYYGDGYYWSFYNDGWYMWNNDRWVYSYSRPRHHVIVRSPSRGHGGHVSPGRNWRPQVRDHRHGSSARAPVFRAPPPRAAPAPRTRVRDHRR